MRDGLSEGGRKNFILFKLQLYHNNYLHPWVDDDDGDDE